MNKVWKAFAAGGAVLGLFGAIALARRDQTSSSSAKRVALIGDSYAVGLGPELEKLIHGLRGEAYVGATTTAWVEHLRNGRRGGWIPDFHPTDVLVSLGVNDGNAPNPANYQSIVRTLHGIGAKVVWIAPPPSIDTPARNVIASLGVPVIEASPMQLTNLHPTGAGYQAWAREIAKEILR